MSRVITADAFDALADLDAKSVHAVVTDPPYGLAFMGRDWDDFEPREYQEWCEEWAGLALDVLKPGGHLLAFSGNRTHHRLFSGVEDAGFEVRDTLTWHYGSGFPKALDVSKAIDKAAGAEREVVGTRRQRANSEDSNVDLNNSAAPVEHITEPATDAAREWDGFKTALKPATEFIVLARKPFEGTVAENVQAHGTGALNVGDCRIGTGERTNDPAGNPETGSSFGMFEQGMSADAEPTKAEGRYPANVIFDAEAAERLDRENEHGDPSPERVGEKGGNDGALEDFAGSTADAVGRWPADPGGGPSRYFYTSKATRAERTLDGKIENAHPTVKPIGLMEWLVRLVTAEGQHVLDPFAGTGTTGRAAKNLGREFTLIERNPEWADVARARCGLTPDDPSILTPDGQTTLATD